MDMTLDVMAHSLVYWAQDVWRAGLFGRGSKIYAMTSEGSTRVVASAMARSARQSRALESHCRQLAMEFARQRLRRDRQRDPRWRHGDARADADSRAPGSSSTTRRAATRTAA